MTGSRPVFITVAAVVAALVVASSLWVSPSGSVTTVAPGQTKTSVPSVSGLKLTLEISTAGARAGGTVTINVTETNTNASPLNESAARDWKVSGLRMNACYSSVYPFGVAVYQGHYDERNISVATPVNLYPPVPCPLFMRLITGYYFQGSSSVAQVLPGTAPGLAMASGVTTRGNYTASGLTDFTPGRYTVVAGDEWGAVAFLYFVVQ